MSTKKDNTRARSRQRPQYTTIQPEGSLASDSFEALTMSDDSLSDIDIQPGDTAIVFLTTDIASGDLVLHRAGRCACISRYTPTPDKGILLEPLDDEYETDVYHPGQVKITGRVIRFERDGKILSLPVKLRPLRSAVKKRSRKQQSKSEQERRVRELRERINRLDDCPSTESIRFQLETEIYRIEHGEDEGDDSILDADWIG